MTRTRRIVLNIVATYGRSVLAVLCGIFTSRWALMALGHQDYGLYGVVGGMTGAIIVMNGLLGGSVGQFFAISIGKAEVDANDDALEECRRWFSISVLINTIGPIVLISIGYPLGIWVIENYLVIPDGRTPHCIWVWRFVLINCFIGMLNVPYQAMYRAKQYIAELTIYSVVQTVLNTIFLYYMALTPGEWLVGYALMICLTSSIPQLIICLRARMVFPECRFSFSYCCDWRRLKELMRFAGWQVLGVVALAANGQGIPFLVNKIFGARLNASMMVANTVNYQTQSLSNALMGALGPAIQNAYGAGNRSLLKSLVERSSKLAPLLVLVFSVPLFVELPYVLKIWLKDPPQYVTGLCACMMFTTIFEQSSTGYLTAINATGKIALFQTVTCLLLLMAVPVAWVFYKLGFNIHSVVVGLSFAMVSCVCARVWIACRILGYSRKTWLFRVLGPLAMISTLSGATGYLLHFCMPESFIRLVLSSIVVEVTMLPLSWWGLLNEGERVFIKEKLFERFKR